jgi:riboflavin synthase
MFTGLIEEVGQIKSVTSIAGGKKIFISAQKITEDISVDDSIAVNGVCLTVVEFSDVGFYVEAVAETLEKTTIGKLKINNYVNLERAMKLGDRLGGHFVQGHVNDISKIERIEKLGDNYALDIIVPESLEKYMILEGSIALDGISLTIARLEGTKVGINIIPHTWAGTNVRNLNKGDYVNTEVDVIAKYIEKLIPYSITGKQGTKLNATRLKALGF